MNIFTTVRIVLWEAIEAFGPHFRWKCRVWLNVDCFQVDNKVLHCLVILRRHCKHCCKKLRLGWLEGIAGQNRFSAKFASFWCLGRVKAAAPDSNAREHLPEGSVGDYFKIEISHCDCQWRALLFTSLNIVSCVCPALLGFQQKVYNWYVYIVFKHSRPYSVHLLVVFVGLGKCAVSKDLCWVVF